jgi:hypothetical protein
VARTVRTRRTAQALAVAALLTIAGCASAKVDNPSFLKDLSSGTSAEVTIRGPVTKLLPDYSGPTGPHEYFDVSVGGQPVEIDYNLSLAPRVPVAVGDVVEVHGQFNPDPGNPNIDYVHRSTGGHAGGWVVLHGHKYW